MNFVDLPQTLSWRSLLPKIEPKTACMILKGEDDFILGWGVKDELSRTDKDFTLEDFQAFKDKHQDEYLLGYFGYDLKNVVEPKLSSKNQDYLGFPDAYWFLPENVLICKDGKCIFKGIEDLNELAKRPHHPLEQDSIALNPVTPKEAYLDHIQKILDHIQRGDIYEVNYCVNFEGTGKLDPYSTFEQLYNKAQAPFSTFISLNGRYVISASPERFLLKAGSKLISQPIKGTARRDSDPIKDKELANQLENDQKERAENVMIVDLVRNDLSKVAAENSVKVPELFKVYTFNTVHQLISTVECEINEGVTEADILQALFPMGSMTGAPKFSAMQIAEEQEDFKRGVYSGSIGVFYPDGNFDLNVVIRSILYNSKTKVVSAAVGGAITIKSDPEKEYDECRLKLKALEEVLC